MSADWTLVGQAHAREMLRVAAEARRSLTVLSPFVSERAAAELIGALPPDRRVAVHLVTAADPMAIVEGSCQLSALRMVAEHRFGGHVYRLHRLHAKVYVADHTVALVTSANLTGGGLRANYEYGILVRDPHTVASICQDVQGYLSIATPLDARVLGDLEALLQRTALPRRREPAVREAVAAIEDVLLREHVVGRTEHEVFASAVLFVLRREGALATEDLHPHIQALHPELCDDSRDRVIDGRHFGKRWKHQVRNAQQYLKDKGLIELADGLWHLTDDGGS